MATLKQKKAAEKIMENHGNVSKTMIEVGYTPASAKNPKNLTESEGWKELMEKTLPDTLLTKRHRELLDKREIVYTYVDGEKEAEMIDQPDTQAVSKGLEMAYKLKGKINDVPPPSSTTTINVNFFSHPEIMEATKNLDNALKKYLINPNETEKPAEIL